MNMELTNPHPSVLDINRELPVTDRVVLEYQNAHVDTRNDLVEHSWRVAGQIQAFAGDTVPSLVIESAKLHDVVDRFWNTDSHKCTEERAHAAWRSMVGVHEKMGLTKEESIYFYAQLHDMVRVEIASGKHRIDMASQAQSGMDGNGLPAQMAEIIADSYKGPVPAKAWLATEPYLDFAHMRSVLNDSNIEAFIVKGCELIDNMQNPSSTRESALLQDALEAESIYAPILEVLGFDGLASVIRSEAHLVRLAKYDDAIEREDVEDNGQIRGPECIDRAREIIENIEKVGVDSIVQHIFGEESSMAQPVVGKNADGIVPVQVGNMLVDWRGQRVDFGHYRLKTVGSLARKMHAKQGAVPMDVMGMTVVSRDDKESAAAFAMFIQQRLQDEQAGLSAKAADGKSSPFYIQGSRKYVSVVAAELRGLGVETNRIQWKPESPEEASRRGHKTLEVAKATFMATIDGVEVPTELQFVTQSERKRMRTGDIAHIIYKYIRQYGENLTDEQRQKTVQDATRVLEEMHARKQHLSPNSLGVNERSLAGAWNMYYALSM